MNTFFFQIFDVIREILCGNLTDLGFGALMPHLLYLCELTFIQPQGQIKIVRHMELPALRLHLILCKRIPEKRPVEHVIKQRDAVTLLRVPGRCHLHPGAINHIPVGIEHLRLDVRIGRTVEVLHDLPVVV